MRCQKGRNPANLHGVNHNVIHHLHLAHQQKTLFLGWNFHLCLRIVRVRLRLIFFIYELHMAGSSGSCLQFDRQ
jgi:hypothetical protein